MYAKSPARPPKPRTPPEQGEDGEDDGPADHGSFTLFAKSINHHR